jgi:hypothetical protein
MEEEGILLHSFLRKQGMKGEGYGDRQGFGRFSGCGCGKTGRKMTETVV